MLISTGLLQTLGPEQQEVRLFGAAEVPREPLAEEALPLLPLPKVFGSGDEKRRYTSQRRHARLTLP